jgi:outer membrane protein assembly factor BamB
MTGVFRTLIAATAICAPLTLTAADWPQWRGPNHNDVVAEASGWNGSQWNVGDARWKTNLGEGSSSPIVVDGKLYGIGWSNNRDTLSCLDAATGKVLWQTSYKSPRYGRKSTGDKSIYAGATATPTFDSATGYLYTQGIDGDLICWDTRQKGRRIWSINFYDEYKVKQRPNVGKRRNMLRDYGYVGSPFIHKDVVIAEVGDDEGALMAFNKTNGKRQWVSDCKDEAGHTGGLVPMTIGNVPCVAVLTLRNLVVVRIDGNNAGKTVAEYPWTTDFGNNIATPAVQGDSVIITSAYNHYAMCKVKITLKGATKVWEQPNPSGVCSPIIHDGRVYWAWRGVHCIDFATGNEVWTGGKVGSPGSCILTGDNRLIVWANNGDLSLVDTAAHSPKRYNELAAHKRLASKDAWPHVVLADGRLYCKDRLGNVRCFMLPTKPDANAPPRSSDN